MEDQEAQLKIVELNNLVKSLQETLALMEAENQVLRKQILNSSGNCNVQLSSQDHEESIEALIDCVEHRVGIVPGKPVAAVTIYKCLLNWKSFEAEKTCVFDRLLQMIDSASKNSNDTDDLAYWLANASTLLILLQTNLKASTSAGFRKCKGLSKMEKGFSALSASTTHDGSIMAHQVEAEYPALLFKLQLTTLVETIYTMARENLKKDLTPLLSLAIQIPSVLIEKMMCQIFSFINVQLFNSILLRRECCTFSNGEYLKYGLSELEAWCEKLEEIGSPWNELEHIKQATAFLVTLQKYKVSYEELTQSICPALNVQQLYRICTQYRDDKYNSQSLSPNVLNSMRALMTDETSDVDSSDFLLDDDTSIPFTLFEIYNGVEDKEFLQITIPKEILEIPALKFVQS